jgi:hypothetical protein
VFFADVCLLGLAVPIPNLREQRLGFLELEDEVADFLKFFHETAVEDIGHRTVLFVDKTETHPQHLFIAPLWVFDLVFHEIEVDAAEDLLG